MKITASYLTGRCTSGAERGKGKLYHGVPEGSYRALCGAKPGRHSAGWSWNDGNKVTCPRCLKKMERGGSAMTPNTRPLTLLLLIIALILSGCAHTMTTERRTVDSTDFMITRDK